MMMIEHNIKTCTLLLIDPKFDIDWLVFHISQRSVSSRGGFGSGGSVMGVIFYPNRSGWSVGYGRVGQVFFGWWRWWCRGKKW